MMLLYALVFVMLFIGIFDRPPTENSETRSSALEGITDTAVVSLTSSSLEVGPDKDEVPAAEEASPLAEGLLPGDILLGRCRMSFVPSLNPHNGWTHAALYAGDDKLIVASNPRSGVIETRLDAWAYPKMTWVVYLRPNGADKDMKERAVEFARRKKGLPYDINWLSKQEDGGSWYCSELIWAAYLHASGGNIDLARRPGWFGISPDDIFMSDDVAVFGGHFEKKPDTIYSLLMKTFVLCILAAGSGILAPHFLFSSGRRRRSPELPSGFTAV